MKVFGSTIFIVLFFTGCVPLFHTCPPQPIFQSMPTIEAKKHSWEDMMCKSVKNGIPTGEYKQMHSLTSDEWQNEQEHDINTRILNNICATSVNGYLKSKDKN